MDETRPHDVLRFSCWVTWASIPFLGGQGTTTISYRRVECDRWYAWLVGPTVVHCRQEIVVLHLRALRWLPLPHRTMIQVIDDTGRTVYAGAWFRSYRRIAAALEQADFVVQEEAGWLAGSGAYSPARILALLGVLCIPSLATVLASIH
jgi:hypothetical protein